MVNYWVRTPQWLKRLSPRDITWGMPGDEPAVYLTFDDGPHPDITTFVLNELKQYDAKATFFCVGNNVSQYPETYQRISAEGHVTGNHTYDHMNGWKHDNFTYLKNIARAHQLIENRIFRPPYGRIKISQARKLVNANPAWKIYMWDIITGDFDKSITPAQCTAHAIDNLQPGSIVVFHDSEKAWDRMHIALPEVLRFCKEKGWELKALPV